MIGTKTEAVEKFWQDCRRNYSIDQQSYFAGTFGEPRFATYHDVLLDLVAAGKKRATAHLAMDFERNQIQRREPGDYWLLLDAENTPKYLVRITDVEAKPFNQVAESFASREGEGDSSLQYWQNVHREYFQQQCAEWGIEWREDYPTVCEGFELVATAK